VDPTRWAFFDKDEFFFFFLFTRIICCSRTGKDPNALWPTIHIYVFSSLSLCPQWKGFKESLAAHARLISAMFELLHGLNSPNAITYRTFLNFFCYIYISNYLLWRKLEFLHFSFHFLFSLLLQDSEFCFNKFVLKVRSSA